MPGNLKAVLGSVLRNPAILRTKPSVNLFLLDYLRSFRIRTVGRHVVVHSHLPPLNSRAYGRFVKEHLLGKSTGPSHAQVGLTNACPQRCAYCYNRDRSGVAMDTATILETIAALQDLGVFWLGFTGGEPLLNKDIVRITAAAAKHCAVKLFTTGCSLTPALAAELRDAGLFSVSISLDHWTPEVHDRGRGFPGAFAAALQAIETFKAAGGVHVGVSAVLPREMIRGGQFETFIRFLRGLGIDEAWLSETKPSVPALWKDDTVISEEERRRLVEWQDRCNRSGSLTINYLAHFEGAERFGCNAGHKMVYIDAFGDVSPCVFTPMVFGNVREQPLPDIWQALRRNFAPSSGCFVNRNFRLLQKHSPAGLPLSAEASLALLKEVSFGPPGRFLQLLHGRREA